MKLMVVEAWKFQQRETVMSKWRRMSVVLLWMYKKMKKQRCSKTWR